MSLDKKIIAGLGFLGWAVLAFFSIWNIRAVFNFSCYFLSSWPFCTGLNEGGALQIQGLILVCVFSILAAVGYFSFKNFSQSSFLFGYVGAGLILALAFFTLPFASNDVQFYFSVGKSVDSGINPYTQSWNLENNFFYPPTTVPIVGVMYGPFMLGIFSKIYTLSVGNEFYFILLWKVFMLLTTAAFIFLLAKIGNVSPKDKKFFYLFWLVQPLVLFEWVGNGHFDSLWLIFLLLAFIFARKNWWGMVVVSLVIGVWFKFVPLLFAPWFVLWWWQEIDKNNWVKRLACSFFGLGVGALITVFAWWPYWQGFKVFAPLALQSKWAVNSLFAALYFSVKPIAIFLFAEQAHWFLTRFLHLVLLCISVYFFWPLLKNVRTILLKEQRWSLEQYASAMFISFMIFLLIWQKSFWPWYAIWLVGIGMINYFLTKNVFLGRMLIWFFAAPLLFYIPWMLSGGDTVSPFFYWYVVLLMVVYPGWQLWLWRKINYSL